MCWHPVLHLDEDVAVVRNAVELGGGHPGVAEHRHPFPEERLVVSISEVFS